MKLLTKVLQDKMPAIYATEDIESKDKIAMVKFFSPEGSATWYGIEYDETRREFFGYVTGLGSDEFGYFSLDELEQLKTPMLGLGIERDYSFQPTAIWQIKQGRN